jgi:hypothetical protein
VGRSPAGGAACPSPGWRRGTLDLRAIRTPVSRRRALPEAAIMRRADTSNMARETALARLGDPDPRQILAVPFRVMAPRGGREIWPTFGSWPRSASAVPTIRR